LSNRQRFDNGKARPAWAMDDRKLWLHIAGGKLAQRFMIAQMYWQRNDSATEIATYLGMSRNSVKSILSRLVRKKVAVP
jgi:hypothetical protein